MKKIYRLKKNEDFSKIIKKKKSFSNKSYILYIDKKNDEQAKIGISVSKKIGNAVVRNKIKRQIRMMLIEKEYYKIIKHDIIIIVRVNYLLNKYDENKKYLDFIMKTSKII